ncbi:ankyrin repeat protein, putative [Trichomonas vaginalis G3]|uniref:Ankyrin repeat protein, putative n=1 Tax=Trichomonas vaginalis (strain ATCC PRA-98 / G3) TaxID=412133 RepID=A2DZB8_TRIV3|nr:proteasome regulatory particle assembly [Trichomonas vaginalis G3]EAY14247.1 ankyrin repeat protein, putative [Trichomonas vaginalis G3]KAI5491895.1 proteasome regulatory particle assembly [Trichomonas vaginalis G3]|eukprot:XP_001326470.1 ankyrin repeat protein [Trichomonas vaginalis G3]
MEILQFILQSKIVILVKFLLSHGANISLQNFDGETVLHVAINGNFSNSKDKHGETALMIAAERNKCKIAKILISHGASINIKDNYLQTALHYAAVYDSAKMTEFLLSQGTYINLKDKNGWTPLHHAVFRKKLI